MTKEKRNRPTTGDSPLKMGSLWIQAYRLNPSKPSSQESRGFNHGSVNELEDLGDNLRLYKGDCRRLIASLPDNSVDSVVTDPPYEIGFMNRSFDSTGIAFDVDLWKDILRVLAFVRNGDSLMSPARNAAPSWVIPTVRNRDAGTCADTPDHGMKPQMSATSVRNMISSSSGTRNRTVARNFGIT